MTDTEMRVREMLAESGIDGEGTDELFACLSDLDRYLDEVPPEPSPELAALMAGLARDIVVTPFSRRRTRLFLAGAAAFGTVAAGGIAAAANELPPAAQTFVAEFSERFLPFELPHPDGVRRPHTTQTDETTVTVPDDDVIPGGVPVTTPDAGDATVEEPSVEPAASPSPSALPSPSVEPTPSVDVTATADPSTVPAPTDAPSEAPSGEETQAGESPSAEPSESSEPSASPSGSTSPSPTANTRTEAEEEPSGSASPSASASGSASPSPSGSSPSGSSSSGSSPSAVWSDE